MRRESTFFSSMLIVLIVCVLMTSCDFFSKKKPNPAPIEEFDTIVMADDTLAETLFDENQPHFQLNRLTFHKQHVNCTYESLPTDPMIPGYTNYEIVCEVIRMECIDREGESDNFVVDRNSSKVKTFTRRITIPDELSSCPGLRDTVIKYGVGGEFVGLSEGQFEEKLREGMPSDASWAEGSDYGTYLYYETKLTFNENMNNRGVLNLYHYGSFMSTDYEETHLFELTPKGCVKTNDMSILKRVPYEREDHYEPFDYFAVEEESMSYGCDLDDYVIYENHARYDLPNSEYFTSSEYDWIMSYADGIYDKSNKSMLKVVKEEADLHYDSFLNSQDNYGLDTWWGNDSNEKSIEMKYDERSGLLVVHNSLSFHELGMGFENGLEFSNYVLDLPNRRELKLEDILSEEGMQFLSRRYVERMSEDGLKVVKSGTGQELFPEMQMYSVDDPDTDDYSYSYGDGGESDTYRDFSVVEEGLALNYVYYSYSGDRSYSDEHVVIVTKEELKPFMIRGTAAYDFLYGEGENDSNE